MAMTHERLAVSSGFHTILTNYRVSGSPNVQNPQPTTSLLVDFLSILLSFFDMFLPYFAILLKAFTFFVYSFTNHLFFLHFPVIFHHPPSCCTPCSQDF